MRLIKKARVYLIALAVLVFAAGSVKAGGVIEEWVARYNGPGNGNDTARAIAVDGSGDVYVTGTSYGSGTSSDYATIKYDSAGNELWIARFNGPAGSGDDGATAIAVDGSGNVYVTGYIWDPCTSWDYTTIKYDSAGNEIWVRRYNEPGNSSDWAYAIVVDSSGNIYVTGGGNDYATIKYDPNGNEIWVRRYNGPGNNDDYAQAITVDGSGNVYVTGASDVNAVTACSDYATVKYDTNGNELWVHRYDGPGNKWDWAYAIAVDSSGNVYVTGYSWSGTDNDYATIKYDPNGNEIWVERYNGPGNYHDDAQAIAVDDSGNIYVTGESHGIGTDYDYATIKYDTNGNEIWVARYNGPGNSWDYAKAIALDGSGNIYVTGESHGIGTYGDYATIKYDSAGNEIWVRRYDRGYNDADEALALSVDGSGNVFVTGYSYDSSTHYDYATIKYAQCLSPISGDLDEDCKVNFTDFAIFAMAWLGNDLTDLTLIAEDWLKCNWSAPEVCW